MGVCRNPFSCPLKFVWRDYCENRYVTQCRSIKRRDGAAVSSAVNCTQYPYLRVATRNKSWAGLSLLYAGRTAPGGLGQAVPGFPGSPPVPLTSAAEGGKAAWPETWRRTTRRAR